MDILAQMRSAVYIALTGGTESTLFPPPTVDLAINQAYRKAGGMFNWPELEDAKKTSTEEDQEYYDYPRNWRPDSIWKLSVDSEDLGDPLIYRDYMYEVENNFPSGERSIWSSQWRRFFIMVNGAAPTSDGNNNISVWGIKVVETLSLDADTTIFSYSMPECNEALVLEATAILRAKGEDEKRSEFKSAEALRIMSVANKKIRDNQAKYESRRPFFDVPDFFRRSRSRTTTRKGNFDL